MPKILAIETATEACSAALIISDKANQTMPRIESKFKLAPREHTQLILPMVENLIKAGECEMQELDAIAFGRGPGAFTGLRIAAGVVQGLALAVDKPVISVSTLAALALQATTYEDFNGQNIIAALDARMGEVYWGVFEFKRGVIEPVSDEKVSKMDKVGEYIEQVAESDFIGIGSAWDAYPLIDSIQELTIIEDAFPAAKEVAQLALLDFKAQRTVAVEDAQPVYIRNNVAEKSKK